MFKNNILKFFSIGMKIALTKIKEICKLFNFFSLTYWLNFSELSQTQFFILLFILFIIYDMSFPKKSKVNK